MPELTCPRCGVDLPCFTDASAALEEAVARGARVVSVVARPLHEEPAEAGVFAFVELDSTESD